VSARNALHLQAGQALAASGAPVERAGQLLLAGMTVDARTVTWLAESADRLSARAPALAADLLRRVLDGADPADDQVGPLRLWLATALLRGGRFAEAEAAATEALAADPDGESAAQQHWILVHSLVNQGRVSDALAEARRALDGGHLTRAERARFHGLAAQCLHVLSTRPEPALRAAEAARDEGLASGDAHAMAYGLQAIAGAMRWHGRFRESLELAEQAAAALQRAGPIIDGQLDPNLIRANCLFDLDQDTQAQQVYAADLPDLAAIAVALGRQATARRAVAQLDRYAADRDVPALLRSVSFAAGILEGDAGALVKVADGYAAAGRPLLEGQAREHAADMMAAAGGVREARVQLAAAQDRYTRLDAAWDAARADARLRAHGVRRGTHGPRQRPKAGWAALTETERRVAALLAEGLSNPEIAGRLFTSRRTVQFHVSNILAKLGLSSRVELATLVARRSG
jgi:DNA-binding CsgD family transcriptional regulator/tetratricopeptide (TPR) repeat protein